jgi:hypothetical protein
VAIWRKIPKKWIGPRTVLFDDGTHIWVREQNGEKRPYARERVKRYAPGIEHWLELDTSAAGDSTLTPHGPTCEVSQSHAKGVPAPGNEECGSGPAEGSTQVARVAIASAPTSPLPPEPPVLGLNVIRGLLPELEDPVHLDESFATEVVRKSHPRYPEFAAPRAKEVQGLQSQNVFEALRIPLAARKGLVVFGSRFVDTIKNVATTNELLKSRLVAQATRHQDADKSLLFTYSPTTFKETVKSMVATAAALRLPLLTRDVSQAYVSSESLLSREIYIIPPRALNLDKDILWRVLKPLYGLPESGLHWFERFRRYHQRQLGMTADVVDPCLYVKQMRTSEGQTPIDGAICTVVDDSLILGTPDFLALEERESATFKSKGRQAVDTTGVTFNGLFVRRTQSGFVMNQRDYIENIPQGPCPRTRDDFASIRGSASYATANTRPDVVAAVNMLSQVVPASATEKDFISLDEAVHKLKTSPIDLRYDGLGVEPICLRVYADASFANNPDLMSQIGHVAFIVDKHHKCALLSWSSHKCKRVTRSVLAAELYALAGAFAYGYAIRHSLQSLLGRPVNIFLFTDSMTLFNSITTLCKMSERRLQIDIAILRAAYRSGDLNNLGWVRSKFMLADPMTKPLHHEYFLQVLRTGILTHEIGQWVDKATLPAQDSWFEQ